MPLTDVTVGNSTLTVSSIGYGAWPLSYEGRPSEEDAIAVLHQAFDRGVKLVDTSDAYCKDESEKHHNEKLIAKAISTYTGERDAAQIIIATKGICIRPEGRWERKATPEHVAVAVAGSYAALNSARVAAGEEPKPIDLWHVEITTAQQSTMNVREDPGDLVTLLCFAHVRRRASDDHQQMHWCVPMTPPRPATDTLIPLEPLLAPVAKAVEEGKIAYVGLSNCTVEQLEAAKAVLPKGTLISVQNRFNLFDRSAEKDGVLEYCEKEGLAFLPWSPLGGRASAGDKKALHDVAMFPNLNAVAKAVARSPEATVLAYMQAKWPCIIHIASARQLKHLDDNLTSVEITLSPEQVQMIDNDSGPDA